MSRPRSAAPAWLAAVWSLVAAAAPHAAEADTQLPFVRVNVAADALADVPLGTGRYVPMPLPEFEEAVARLGPMGRRFRVGVAAEARYQLAFDAADSLFGTVEFRVGDAAAGLPGFVPLGRLTAGPCSVATAEGSGSAAVFCLADGTAAVRTPGPGSYTCQIRLARVPGDTIIRLPLVPALVTTVELVLRDAARPVVIGPEASATLVEPAPVDAAGWRILRGPVGPGSELTFLIQDGRRAPPIVRAWNCVTIRGRQADHVALLEPMGHWIPGRLELDAAATLRITEVVSLPDRAPVEWTSEDGRLTLDVPGRLAGSRHGIVARGVAEAGSASLSAVPVLEPLATRWGGCNTRLAVDPALALQRVLLEECRAVSPTAAARWPLPATEPLAPAAGIEPALVFFEHEAPRAEVRVAIGPRAASLDTARVTTVDILPGTVLGRTAAEIRVVAGQVFGFSADLAPGWFIDSVETVDWSTGREPGVGAGPPPEWRVIRSPRGSELRIGLPLAATPRRGLGLLINGHRSGLPLGAEFSSDDMDMVRFPGETALLEFQLGPNAVLEAAGGSLGLEPVPERLAPLVPRAAPRARIPAGERAPAARARLVRRRPPVAAEVAVDLFARDDRLAETFSFTCRPEAGELDAVVVHFSQPMPDLEWSLAGDGGSLAAQPLDRDDATRGELRAESLVAESWLVELRPATAAAVTFRAARTVPLADAVAVPLAWVEAAEQPGGVVTVRGEPGRRPTVVNHQLRELPPAADGNPALIKLAYGSPRSLDGGRPVADVAGPPPTAAPRAWAWRQATTCWCFESGALEWETSFDIENHGRESATIMLPEGLRVEGVAVADEPVAAAAIGPDMRELAVALPQAAGRIKLVIRGSGDRSAGLGWWPLGAVACGIDMPVLDPKTTLLLPPGLELAAGAGTGDSRPWAMRLLGGSFGSPPSAAAGRVGFRAVPIPAAVGGSPIVIRKDLVRSLAIMVAAAATLAGFMMARRFGPLAIAACGAAACTALWCASPWDELARGALWGGVAGAWTAGWRLRVGVGAAWLVATAWGLAGSTAAAAETDPVRVYVAPDDDGGMALVPEALFRRLSAAAATVGPPTVRVLATDVVADVTRGSWRVGFELDADQGGGLILDQRSTGAVWRLPAEPPPGLSVALDAEARVARISASAAGRHRLALDLEPVVARTGDIDLATIALPPAPRAGLRLVEVDGAGGGWQCDQATAEGPWLPAAVADGGFEIATAARVRLVRAVDPRATVVAALGAAVSFNDIDWQQNGCLLTATFDVGGERQIVRSLMIRADQALEPVDGGDNVPQPLGGGRYLIELPAPRTGQRRVVVAFRMPLADPVGIFDAPFAWLSAAETDVRTVRLRPAPELEIAPDLPVGITLVKPREEDGAATKAVWRSDALAKGTDAGAEQRPRIVVRRRAQKPAVVQDLVVEFADDHVALVLRCRLDAGGEPLLEIPFVVPPAAIIDGITLTREPSADAAAEPLQPLDINWSREAADRIVAVVQRPETGRFRLQLDARLPIRPARRGRLPVARLALDDAPLEVSCRAAAGGGVRIEREAAAGVAPALVELASGAAAPAYVLSRDPAPAPDADEAADEAAALVAGQPAVATTIDLAVDGLGRAWGLVRFDVVAVEPVVRLVLPAGLRLFDVRADGREVTAMPAEGNAWDVRLHDVAWPRSLVAVVAGSIGGRLADGGAIRLEPPRLAGLTAGEVLWSIDTPTGFAVRVSEPARVLDAAAFAAARGRVRDGLDVAFREAIRGVRREEREPLEGFASTRRDGGGPVGEQSWYEAWRATSAGEPNRALIAPGGDGSLTLRAVRLGGGAVPARGLATAAIVAGVAASWLAARRYPEAARRLARVVRRWWWLACGAGWLATLQPAWPGVVMLAAGAWVARWPAGDQLRPSDRSPADNDSTLSFAAD